MRTLSRINLCDSKKLLALSIFMLFLFSMSCGPVGMLVGGPIQTYHGKYSIELMSPRSDILDVIADVGKSMSLDISLMNASKGMIALSTGVSITCLTMLIAKSDSQKILVTSIDGGKKLDINIMVVGNFDAGTKEAGDKLFSDFKSRVLEKVK